MHHVMSCVAFNMIISSIISWILQENSSWLKSSITAQVRACSCDDLASGFTLSELFEILTNLTEFEYNLTKFHKKWKNPKILVEIVACRGSKILSRNFRPPAYHWRFCSSSWSIATSSWTGGRPTDLYCPARHHEAMYNAWLWLMVSRLHVGHAHPWQ